MKRQGETTQGSSGTTEILCETTSSEIESAREKPTATQPTGGGDSVLS
jgi:hypothetical protein